MTERDGRCFVDLELAHHSGGGDPLIEPIDAGDAGELLTLQRAAYVTEARIYGDPALPALVQSLDELIEELSRSLAFKVTAGRRMIGAVRAQAEAEVLHVGRLVVAPDQQGRGLGTALLRSVERSAGPEVRRAALFTGHLSFANIRLYERLGYVEERREELKPGVVLVHLTKPLFH